MAKSKLTVEERFWSKVERNAPDECWPWTAGRFLGGYGLFSIGNRDFGAHRIAWRLLHGPIPDRKHVCHRCDNPACCNPGHLFLGTNADNMRDRDSKGRQARGTRHPRAKLTDDLVRAIRADGRGSKALSKALGVSRTVIRNVLLGLRWRHVR